MRRKYPFWCMALAVFVGCLLSQVSAGFAWQHAERPRPCRCLAAPGFDLIEFRIQEPGTGAWARYRVTDGEPELIGWED